MKYFILSVFLIWGTIACAGEKLRIVSLSPSLTETVFQLGQENLLVGRSTVCDYPQKAKKIEVAGNFGAPYMEKLAELKPDAVIFSAMKDPSSRKTIEALGIKVLLLPTENIEDYYSAVKKLGELLNCRENAEKEIERIKSGLDMFKEKAATIPLDKQPVVYLEVWNNPLMTAGRKSFLNQYISYAGGRNIAETQEKDYFNCSEEWIVTSNPDVIISPAMGKGREGDFAKRPGWDKIKAVKNNRIYINLNQSLIYRMGPRILESIALIRSCIYPPQNEAN